VLWSEQLEMAKKGLVLKGVKGYNLDFQMGFLIAEEFNKATPIRIFKVVWYCAFSTILKIDYRDGAGTNADLLRLN